MKHTVSWWLILGVLLSASVHLEAQRVDTLTTVTVHSKSTEAISPVAVQHINEQELQKLNSTSVADAVKFLSGVMIKDYGGIGGLKTISVRSLGAQHTGVMYDGVMLSDARAGQTDLGRISMENISEISLYQSSPSPWLQPARAFSQVAVLAINTQAVNDNRPDNLLLKLSAASFESYSAAVATKRKLNKNLNWLLNGFYQQAAGDYPFKSYEDGNDIKHYRTNSDIKQWKIESDLPIVFKDSSTLNVKLFYYRSDRGLPGSIVFYNPSSSERLNNRTGFVQIAWHKILSNQVHLKLSGKSSIDRQIYIDNNFSNNTGYLKNDFIQHENYFSAALGWKMASTLSSGLATDIFFNSLRRKDEFDAGFVSPNRKTIMSNAFVRWANRRAEVQGNLLVTHISQTVALGNAGKDISRAAPAIAFSLQPAPALPLRLRVFYKNVFRAPSLDDLFYTVVGNPDLKPELAKQFDIGLTYEYHNTGKAVSSFSVAIDGYIMDVKDKIIAMPRNNLFQWSMANLGKVQTLGLDVAASTEIEVQKGFSIGLHLNYGFQDAKDKTAKLDYTYNKQIPFVPINSGSFRLSVTAGRFSGAFNSLFSDYRYRQGVQNSDNLINGYILNDVYVGYRWLVNEKWQMKSQFEVNNIFNQSYEVIKFFPMPGINWRIGLIFENKKTK